MWLHSKQLSIKSSFARGLGCCAVTALLSGISWTSAAQSGVTEPPEFTLVGSTRIGNRFTAVLRNKQGGNIVVAGRYGSSATIAGYPDYTLLNFEARKVLIELPQHLNCTENLEMGVDCEDERTMALHLKASAINRLYYGSDDQSGISTSPNDMQDLPAADGSMMESLQNQAAGTEQRAEVPEGMTLVETPSGFRLVPDD